MEDLWNDIILSSLHNNRQTPTNHHHHHHFRPNHIARPCPLHHTKNILLSPSSLAEPQTVLSLNTDSSSGHSHPQSDNPIAERSDELPCDRRFKQMIRNRGSAARSRSRKKAYTHELELKVAHLKQENARLKMEQEQEMRNQPPSDPSPKKHKLVRTLTAPF